MGDTVISGPYSISVSPLPSAILSYGTNKVVEALDGIPFPNTIPLK